MMRCFLAGLFVLLACGGGALAQVTGEVVGMGFEGYYRPDCWTPLRVRLKSTLEAPGEYQIQVHQQDLDNDTVVYSHAVTVGSQVGKNAPPAQQEFWTYFIPQPVGKRDAFGGGLPSKRDLLNGTLKVHLYDKDGQRHIALLPITFDINNIDPAIVGGGFGGQRRGRKLIVCVVDRSQPSWAEYPSSLGISEDVDFVLVRPSALPESVLGYEAVDAIAWFDADASAAAAGGSKAIEAIRQYVRQGGRLVVSQPASREAFAKIAPFADLLPIDLGAARVESKKDLRPLSSLAHQRRRAEITSAADDWGRLEASRPQWDFIRAAPRSDAVVEASIRWDNKPDLDATAERSPYIARRAVDLGTVTWVAQDLGSRALGSATVPDPDHPGQSLLARSTGWPHVWDVVFGWRNDTYTLAEIKGAEAQLGASEAVKYQYAEGAPIDVGAALLKGMEHSARGAAYIFLAVIFFIGYWLIAGPGSFWFLAARRKKGLSWLAFAAAALGATALTVGVVKLVLRGRPEARHVSFVRLSPADPAADGSPRFSAVIDSRMGLYIPRDGEQRVALTQTTPDRVSFLVPFPVHPQHLMEGGFTDTAKYVVNIDQFGAGGRIEVDFPYRSTNKQIAAHWTGAVAEGIVGQAALAPVGQAIDGTTGKTRKTGTITGRLTNATGRDLTDAYIAFEYGSLDWVLYVPLWSKDVTLDLEAEFNRADNLDPQSDSVSRMKPTRGVLTEMAWGKFWHRGLSPGLGGDQIAFDDSERRLMRSLPLMAFFDRIGPQRGIKNESWRRWDVLRRGGRDLDVSHLIAAGRLVVVAQSASATPLPVPLEVNGDKVAGDGTVIYEVVLPLDRSRLIASAATRPTTEPAGEESAETPQAAP